MGNYTIFLMFENPRRDRQARNFTEKDPKTLDLKSSFEQIIFQKLSLGAPDRFNRQNNNFARAHFFVHFFAVFALLRRENA